MHFRHILRPLLLRRLVEAHARTSCGVPCLRPTARRAARRATQRAGTPREASVQSVQ